MSGNANISSGKSFWGGSSGRWAGEQLLRAMQRNGSFSSADLRTLDTLRKDEWKEFDEVLIQEAMLRLRAVAAVKAAGLTKTITNGLAKTIFEYEKVTDMGDATVSLDGMGKTENERPEFTLHQLPLPIIHKDFYLNLRHLMASRQRGEGLDTTQARAAGRVVAEAVETMFFSGSKTFGGLPIYGALNFPNRNTVAFGTNGNWAQAAKTGDNCLTDVQTMIAAAETDRFYGPYWLFVPTNCSYILEKDFKDHGDLTVRQRLLQVDRLQQIIVCDKLTSSNLVLMQASADVVTMVEGEPLQTIQWDIEGGFQINFKAFTIDIPLFRSDAENRCGVVHMS